MAWSDAGQRSEALPIVCTGCDFAVSNRPAVSTPATAARRCRYQSLTASGMIYDHVSLNCNENWFSSLPFHTTSENPPRSRSALTTPDCTMCVKNLKQSIRLLLPDIFGPTRTLFLGPNSIST